MKKDLTKIRLLPKKIQKLLYKNPNKNIKLIGNLDISKSNRIPIIEFEERERLWVLKHEISNYNVYQ